MMPELGSPTVAIVLDRIDLDMQNSGKKGKAKATTRYVRHKKFGEGIIVETKGEFIVVDFKTVGKKQLNLQLCLDKGLMQFVYNG